MSDGAVPAHRRPIAMAAVVLGNIIASVDNSISAMAVPQVAHALNVAPSSAVLIATVYQLVLMMALLPLSALGERIGLKRMYQTGQLTIVAGAILIFFTPNLGYLVAIRAMQAMGAAAMLSVSPALMRAIYPSSSLGRALGINAMVSSTVAMSAPALGGFILPFASWHWLFAMLAPFGLISMLIGRRTLPNPRVKAERFDMAGALMCAGIFGLVVVGLEVGLRGPSLALSGVILALSVMFGFLFVRREAKRDRPVFPVDLLRRRDIGLSVLAQVSAFIASMMLVLLIPLRAQLDYHFTPVQTGLILAIAPGATLITAPIAGYLSDRISAPYVSAVGVALSGVGVILLGFAPDAPSVSDIVWRFALAGVGMAIFFPANVAHIVSSAPHDRTAAAGGLSATTSGVGRTLGSTLVAALLAISLAAQPAAMFITAIFVVIAMICCLGAVKRT